MHRREIWNRFGPCAFFAVLLTAGSAHAAVSFDVAVGINVNEDARIFLNVSNEVWRPPVPTTVIRGCRYPQDDFPVVAFLAFHSHREPGFILQLRSDGYPWHEIFYRLHVNPSVLFVGIDRDPGPPYGKAWGYWKKNSRPGSDRRVRFSDRDVVGLVKVQTASRHFGASPFAVMDAQRQGKRVEVYTAGRWREKHGRQSWSPGKGEGKGRPESKSGHGKGKEDSPGKGQGKDHGKGGSGHGKGHGR